MLVKNSLEKIKPPRSTRSLSDIRQISLSAADLRAVHFFVEPCGTVHQMAKAGDVISDDETLEIDLLEPSADAFDAIVSLVLSLSDDVRIPKVFIERGSADILSHAFAAKINKSVKYLHDTGVERLPSQLGVVV